MNQYNFGQWEEISGKLIEPFKAITELNIKTLQSLAYFKQEQFAEVKKPEDLMEIQINFIVENGHKALNYMEQSLQIIEKAMKNNVQ